jgi:hypothetical protein
MEPPPLSVQFVVPPTSIDRDSASFSQAVISSLDGVEACAYKDKPCAKKPKKKPNPVMAKIGVTGRFIRLSLQ